MADVPLNPISEMSQVPLNQMPQMSQVPLNQMPQMSQVPLNQLPPVALGPEPCTVTCPSCGDSILTTVTTQPSMQTHLAALLLCCVCVCLVCLPYCTDSCQNADHYCPNCDAYLGSFKR